MNVILDNLGKRFNKQWIFRGLNLELASGQRYVILGSNGSGKSTLLQTIAGYRIPSEGSVSYLDNGKEVDINQQYRFISIASPYLSLIEEFDVDELLKFHYRLKPILPGFTIRDFSTLLELQNISKKPIKLYSSGMKQRLRLALAFFTDAPLLLLDEPCSNLDAQGVKWYRRLLESYTNNRLVIICSNHQENEYSPCENIIDISFYKSVPSLKSR
jgi:ABC-type multidrug transport system ATPase subunit